MSQKSSVLRHPTSKIHQASTQIAQMAGHSNSNKTMYKGWLLSQGLVIKINPDRVIRTLKQSEGVLYCINVVILLIKWLLATIVNICTENID